MWLPTLVCLSSWRLKSSQWDGFTVGMRDGWGEQVNIQSCLKKKIKDYNTRYDLTPETLPQDLQSTLFGKTGNQKGRKRKNEEKKKQQRGKNCPGLNLHLLTYLKKNETKKIKVLKHKHRVCVSSFVDNRIHILVAWREDGGLTDNSTHKWAFKEGDEVKRLLFKEELETRVAPESR